MQVLREISPVIVLLAFRADADADLPRRFSPAHPDGMRPQR